MLRPGARSPSVLRQLGRGSAWLAERCGAGGIKVAQFLSTRYDLLPAEFAAGLRTVRDRCRVDAAPAELLWAWENGDPGSTSIRRRFRDRGALEVVASASVSTVFRLDPDDGGSLALKVLRPRARREIERCSRLIERVGRLGGSRQHGVAIPVRTLGVELATALRRQVDLRAEAQITQRARSYLDRAASPVWVPAVSWQLSDASAICMEWCPPTGPGPSPEQAADLLRAIFGLIFVEGIVHCDLHGGNVYRAGHRMVLLDFGFCYQLSAVERIAFAGFFLGLAEGAPQRAWQGIFPTDESAPGAEFCSLVTKYSRAPVDSFNVREFGHDILACLKRSGRVVPEGFFFPLLSLMMLEGMMHEWGIGTIDFQELAAPYCVQTILLSPETGLS